MTIKKKRVREILIGIRSEIENALKAGEYDLLPSLAHRGLMLAGRHLLRTKGTVVRPSWAQLRRHVSELEALTGISGLAAVGDFIRGEDKSSRYADDEWEYDEDNISENTKIILAFIIKVLELA